MGVVGGSEAAATIPPPPGEGSGVSGFSGLTIKTKQENVEITKDDNSGQMIDCTS